MLTRFWEISDIIVSSASSPTFRKVPSGEEMSSWSASYCSSSSSGQVIVWTKSDILDMASCGNYSKVKTTIWKNLKLGSSVYIFQRHWAQLQVLKASTLVFRLRRVAKILFVWWPWMEGACGTGKFGYSVIYIVLACIKWVLHTCRQVWIRHNSAMMSASYQATHSIPIFIIEHGTLQPPVR
jgi:hypothetical protein